MMAISVEIPVAEASTGSRSSLASGRMPVVDGLRGIAILSVLIFHFALFGFKLREGAALWERIYSSAAGIGWVGVDLFFVLSGFLITGILLDTRDSPNYYRVFYLRRSIRIFPLYYASLAILLGLMPLVLKHTHFRQDVLGAIAQPSSQAFAWFYLLNWRIGLGAWNTVPSYLQHFWSLSIEEQFYLAWPAVVRMLERRWLMMLCAGMVVTSLGLRVMFHELGMPIAAYVLTFCRLDSLAIGGIVALAVRDVRHWRFARGAAPLITGFALIGLIVLVALTGSVSFMGFWMGTVGTSLWSLFFGGCLVIALGAKAGSLVYRTGSSWFLRFFGKYSYCLYVCHQPLIQILAHSGVNSDHLTAVLGSKLAAVFAVNAIAFSIATVIAYLSWHLFEKQVLKLKDLPAMRYAAAPVR
jgi:peptidoglycan/LPS O-acetylase OafA/YrhL